jgi:hypothetical protein
MKRILSVTVALLASGGALANSTCFQAIDPSGNVFYRSYESPVDLSLRLGDAVIAKRFPRGTHVVMSESDKCPPLDVAPIGLTRVAATSADATKEKAPAKKRAGKQQEPQAK